MSRGGAEEEAAGLSPNSRLKFLCSYGGKILPRPSDGQLKYVGGETRVVSVPRSVTFKELKEKISGMFSNTELVIKYQLFPEDLDALVSVRSDEDLHHMLEEYDRHESLPRSPSSAASRFRIFLFPSPSSNATTTPSTSPTYLDAVNGSISMKGSINIPISSGSPLFTLSSACSSPPSILDNTSPLHRLALHAPAPRLGQPGMQRVRSTPNLSGAGSLSQLGNSCSGGSPGGGFYTAHPHNHHHHLHLQQHKGTGRMGGGPHRHDLCGCGCLFPGGQQSHRRHYYPPSSVSPWGHAEELHTPGSSHSSFNFSGAGTPPVAPPRKSIWD